MGLQSTMASTTKAYLVKIGRARAASSVPTRPTKPRPAGVWSCLDLPEAGKPAAGRGRVGERRAKRDARRGGVILIPLQARSPHPDASLSLSVDPPPPGEGEERPPVRLR